MQTDELQRGVAVMPRTVSEHWGVVTGILLNKMPQRKFVNNLKPQTTFVVISLRIQYIFSMNFNRITSLKVISFTPINISKPPFE